MKWLLLLIASTAFADGNPDAGAPPDPALLARKACFKQFGTTFERASARHNAGELAEAASCFHKTGAIDAAMRAWRAIEHDFPASREARVAFREMGPALESQKKIFGAAESYEKYARRYSSEPDARTDIVKALCLWRKLGLEENVNRVRDYMKTQYKEPTLDVAATCAPKPDGAQ